MNSASACRAIGFDLGETLLTYADTPLDWAALYPRALTHVAQHCNLTFSPAEIHAAEEILKRYNTRLHPRTDEVTAKTIFTEIIPHWPTPAAQRVDKIIEAFFAFFQQRIVAYPETLSVLATLRERQIPIGLLTDVPYGMPRDFVQRDGDTFPVADKMIQAAEYYGFDGWFITGVPVRQIFRAPSGSCSASRRTARVRLACGFLT